MLKKGRKIVFSITINLLLAAVAMIIAPQAQAIENGVDATGSVYVVPILIEFANNEFFKCSGALIAPSIVATAGHCILNETGAISEKIYVGDPGSSSEAINSSQLVTSIAIPSGYQGGANGDVAVNDIVFLALSEPKKFDSRIRLASEAEVATLKDNHAQLRLYGYGNANDGGKKVIFPSYTEGSFSTSPILNQPDSGVVEPLIANTCKGDSGGPVVRVTGAEVLVIGIITGTNLRNNCGASYTSFSLVSRYSNLIFSLALKQINQMDLLVKKISADAVKGIATVNELSLSKIASIQSESDAAAEVNQKIITEQGLVIDALNKEIASLKAQLPKVIYCTKGKVIRKVSTAKPACPTGYKSSIKPF